MPWARARTFFTSFCTVHLNTITIIPGDSHIQQKTVEKKDKHTDLWIKAQRIWKTTVSVEPIIIGVLGSIPKELEANLQELGVQKSSIPVLQKSVLLSTCFILRHYLT